MLIHLSFNTFTGNLTDATQVRNRVEGLILKTAEKDERACLRLERGTYQVRITARPERMGDIVQDLCDEGIIDR